MKVKNENQMSIRVSKPYRWIIAELKKEMKQKKWTANFLIQEIVAEHYNRK